MKKKQKNEKKKKKSVLKTILKVLFIIILLIGLTIGGFVAYSTYKNGWGVKGMISTIVGQDEEKLKDLDRIDVLILGVSTDISVKLTDTIIVASYDPKTQTASLLSIPRDTFVGKNKNNANSYDKINCLYQASIDKTLKAVNEITGMDIQYYVVVETTALVKLVDTIGGVEFDVPIDMKYDDSSQNLHIDLKKGYQKLNGNQAEQLVRFRKNNNGTTYSYEYGDNDTGRMRTQREFLTEVLKQTIQLKNIVKIRELLEIAYEYVDTNVSLNVAKDYVPYIIDLDTSTIKTMTLPGVNTMLGNLWFFVPNKNEIIKTMEELYTPVNQEVEEDASQVDSTENTNNASDTQKTNDDADTTNSKKIKIEILDGSENNTKLQKVKNALTNKGYYVQKTTKTTATGKTVIINKTNQSEETTNQIKEILGVGTVSNSSTSGTADITIIIGKDYK